MKPKSVDQPKGTSQLDLEKIENALREAYLHARREAFVHGLPVVLYENGQIVLDKPSPLEFMEQSEIEELRKELLNKSD